MKKINEILFIVLLLIVFISGYYTRYFQNFNPNKEYIRDTTYTNTIDTFIITKPLYYETKVIKIIHDTLLTTDTIPIPVEVNIPIEQKKYKDTLVTKDKDSLAYDISISGYKPNLDSINFSLFKTEKTITNTQVSTKKRKWSVGYNFGLSFDGRNIKPTIGIGIQYSLFNF